MLNGLLSGNVGGDPETRYTANGDAFLRFNVASNYRTRNDEGEWVDATEWVRCTIFGQRAESLGQYIQKGTRVSCVGKLEARPWTDNQGKIRAGLEMMVSEIDFNNPRDGAGGRPDQRDNARNGYSKPPQDRQQAPAQRGQAPAQAQRQQAPAQSTLEDVEDDADLPF